MKINVNGINLPIRTGRTTDLGSKITNATVQKKKLELKGYAKYTRQSKPKGNKNSDIIVKAKVKA